MVRPRSCRVIYYFDTPALGRRHQSFGRVTTPIPFSTDKRLRFLVPHICQIKIDTNTHFPRFKVEYSPRRRTRATEWRLHWGPCGLSFVFVWFVFVFVFGCLLLICLSFCYLLMCFKHFTHIVHALYKTVLCITYFDFEKHTLALS